MTGRESAGPCWPASISSLSCGGRSPRCAPGSAFSLLGGLVALGFAAFRRLAVGELEAGRTSALDRRPGRLTPSGAGSVHPGERASRVFSPRAGSGSLRSVIWAILALIGVPLWLIAIALLMMFFRNRKLRKRPGNMPVRVLPAGKKRWTSGHGIWVSDVFAWRGSPAAWSEDLSEVSGVSLRSASPEERKKLHRIGDDPVVASLALADGVTLQVAARPEHQSTLAGPFVNGLKAHLTRRAQTQRRKEKQCGGSSE